MLLPRRISDNLIIVEREFFVRVCVFFSFLLLTVIRPSEC